MLFKIISVIFILSFLIAFITTRLILKYGKGLALYDRSDERRRKTAEVPRFGGIAIYLGIIASLGISFLAFSKLSEFAFHNFKDSLALFLCTTLIFTIGLYDDLKGADARKKLSIEVLASILLYLFGYRIAVITNPFGFILGSNALFLPGFVSFLLTLFWLVGISNAFNLMDGIDGLASGITIFYSLTMMVVSFHLGHHFIGIFFLAMAGATSGFLPYNMPRAKIIMGDSGSLTLGFLFAALSLKGALKGPFGLAFIIPVLVLSPAILDTIWAAIRRWIQGRPFHNADLDHIHHRMERYIGGPWKPLFALYGLYIVFCVLGSVFVFSVNKAISLFVTSLALLLIALLFYKIGYLRDSGEWLLVRIYGQRMIRANNIQQLWNLLLKIMEKLKFSRARLEIDKTVQLKLASLGEEKDAFIWQKEGKGQASRSIQITLHLKGNGGELGRLVLAKNPGFSKLSSNPSPTVEMLQRYVSRGLQNLIYP